MKIQATLTIAAIAAILALAIVPTLAQGGPALGPQGGQGNGPQFGAGHGPHGQAGPGAQMQGRQQQRPRGFIEATPESKALWQQLGDLKLKEHQAQWEMFEILSAEEPDIEALKAHRQKMMELKQQSREIMKQLAEYRKPLPFRKGQGQMKGQRGGHGQGQHQGQGNRPRGGQGHGQHHGGQNAE